ncbi:multidrug resistance protein homolog 49-like [Teleopsis dalmanni]|uniref:multidrug resistance protein homolog 49-like n=1 Tax=Teleopsis dalmanni TaxID=139649 RepID=UPI0018CFC808|nr:multidrug resistance protein homolog 49-like [Teleopsis dalmanni]
MANSSSNKSTERRTSVLPIEKTCITSQEKSTPLPDRDNLQTINENTVEKNTTKVSNEKQFSYFQLFKYSTTFERFLVAAGIIFASLASVCITYSIIIYAEFASLLIDRSVGIGTSSPATILQLFGGGTKLTNTSREENLQAIRDDALTNTVSLELRIKLG